MNAFLRRNKKYILPILLSVAFLAVMLFPYYYLVLQSVVPWDKVDKTLVPTGLTLKSFIYLFTQSSSTNPYIWARTLLNSFLVSIPTGIISVLVGLLTGYASAKMNFKGKKLIYNLLLFQMFFPTIILLVPRFMIMKDYVNTYIGLILPLCMPIASVFMYINYFKTIPDSIFEAARIDGASELQNVILIAMPATKPISVIVFLTSFTTRWSEVIWDMKMGSDVAYKTLNVMLTSQFSRTDALPGPLYASAVALTLPIIIVFFAFSKYFREGINFMVK